MSHREHSYKRYRNLTGIDVVKSPYVDLVVFRKKESKPPAQTEIAMVPIPLPASSDTDNPPGGAPGKTDPTTNTKASNENEYAFSHYDPPSAAAGGDGADVDNKPSAMYESLPDN